jgi:isoleucyl-tRNA synthetase
MENWQPSGNFDPDTTTNVLDRWIISRLHTTIREVTKTIEKYSTAAATKALEEFVSDLSTWYIRRNRDRLDNFELMNYIFRQLVIILSPFIPYFSEIIFQNLSGSEIAVSNVTVHTQNWPMSNDKLINVDLESQMTKVRQICQLIHAERQKSAIKIRQPLSKVTINTDVKLSPSLISIIAGETNVKEIVIQKGTNILKVELDIQLTPELIAEGEYRDLVRSVQVLRRQADLQIKDRIKIFAPLWPQSFEKEILSKTLSDSIEKSDDLRIEKIG